MFLIRNSSLLLIKSQPKSTLLKIKIQASPNDRFGLKLGTLLAQLGQRACPTWATCLPRMGRFAVRRLPNKWLLYTPIFPYYRILPTQTIPVVWIPHIWQFLSSANHPDNWLTIARWSTICLSEYYNKKPDNLTVFSEIFVFTKNQRYGQLLLISTKLIPPTGYLKIMQKSGQMREMGMHSHFRTVGFI